PSVFFLAAWCSPNGKQPAAKSERQLARGFFTDIEVLVARAAGRAEDASFAPAKFDHFPAAARGVGLGAALLRPEQGVAFRFENHDHRAAAMVVRLVVEPG